MLPELRHRGGDHLSVLYRQVLMAQQHLDSGRDRIGIAIVDGDKHPCRLGDRQMRHPRPVGYERLSRSDLLDVIPRHEPDQHVGVNGAHGAS